MTTPQLTVTVYGRPAPQGSKRHVGKGRMIEMSPNLAPWRKAVKLAAVRALAEQPDWDREAAVIAMYATFTLARPKIHFGTGTSAHLLREGAPSWHHIRPDLDKLIRSTADALTMAGVYLDDSRLSQIFASKVYVSTTAFPPGVLDRPGVRLVLQQP